MLENSLYKKGGPSLPPLDGKCNSRNININMTTTDVCFSVDCLFRKQTRSELFVVKGDCNNNFSVVVCRKILSPPRRFKVKDLICDTSQFFLRNNAFIFFQKSDTKTLGDKWHCRCCFLLKSAATKRTSLHDKQLLNHERPMYMMMIGSRTV